MSTSADQAVRERIQAEYLEMPGMRLKIEQVERLCGIERSICKMVLDSLVEAKFLCLKPDGAYARVSDESSLRARPAKTHLESSAFSVSRTARRAS